MQRDRSKFQITRRRFSFWVGLGLFSLGEKLHAGGFDALAAAVMRGTEPTDAESTTPEHWTLAENNSWFWYERENLLDGKWKLTGITTPIHKNTGERYTGASGYLDDSLVPFEVRSPQEQDEIAELAKFDAADTSQHDREHLPEPSRRARHGRPPSKWLRSLGAEELRVWLKTIDPPEAGVSGMTFWTHLTRDHFFEPKKIAGLTTLEQAKLHGAAHYGY